MSLPQAFPFRRTVALVGPNDGDRIGALAVLRELYDVMEYANAPDALAGFRVVRPDVVVLDAALPDIEETPVIARLRELPALDSVAVIALAAGEASARGTTLLDGGFDDVVIKSGSASQLLQVIERLLSARDRRRSELRSLFG